MHLRSCLEANGGKEFAKDVMKGLKVTGGWRDESRRIKQNSATKRVAGISLAVHAMTVFFFGPFTYKWLLSLLFHELPHTCILLDS